MEGNKSILMLKLAEIKKESIHSKHRVSEWSNVNARRGIAGEESHMSHDPLAPCSHLDQESEAAKQRIGSYDAIFVSESVVRLNPEEWNCQNQVL